MFRTWEVSNNVAYFYEKGFRTWNFWENYVSSADNFHLQFTRIPRATLWLVPIFFFRLFFANFEQRLSQSASFLL